MLKRLKSWWRGRELQSFHDELTTFGNDVAALGDRFDALLARFERMQNTVGMRLARLARTVKRDEPMEDSDEAILAELSAQRGNGHDWPPM